MTRKVYCCQQLIFICWIESCLLGEMLHIYNASRWWGVYFGNWDSSFIFFIPTMIQFLILYLIKGSHMSLQELWKMMAIAIHQMGSSQEDMKALTKKTQQQRTRLFSPITYSQCR